MKKLVSDWLTCVIECATEPCCRSINYKKTLNLQNEPNCEMLHNLVYNDSQELLEANSSYNHVYLGNPRKVKIFHNMKLLILLLHTHACMSKIFKDLKYHCLALRV